VWTGKHPLAAGIACVRMSPAQGFASMVYKTIPEGNYKNASVYASNSAGCAVIA